MRRGRWVIVLVPLLGLWPAPVRAADDDSSGTPCTFEVEVAMSPGLSDHRSSGTFDSKGETGKVDCQGDVGGQRATGPGSFGAEGRYGTDGDGDDCQSKRGQGDGTAHLTIPVEGGTQHIDDPFDLTYRVDGRGVVGEMTGRRFSATFNVTQADGDCLWRPVTKIRIKGKGRLREDTETEVPDPG